MTVGENYTAINMIIPKVTQISFGVVCVVTCPFDISVGVGAFVIGLGQISSFLSYKTYCLSLSKDTVPEGQGYERIMSVNIYFNISH